MSWGQYPLAPFYQLHYINKMHNISPEKQSRLDTEPQAPSAPPPPPRKMPPVVIVLLVLSSLQVALALAVTILKAALGYRGFASTLPMELVPGLCPDYQIVAKFYGQQNNLISVSIVMIIACTAVGVLPLLMIITTMTKVKVLVKTADPGANLKDELSTGSIYKIMGYRYRSLLYLFQSMCVLSGGVCFGYYFSNYIRYVMYTDCPWTRYKTEEIIPIWVISGVLLLVSLILWLIVLVIAVKNNKQEAHVFEADEDPNKYVSLVRQNTTSTHRDPLLVKQTRARRLSQQRTNEVTLEPFNYTYTMTNSPDKYNMTANLSPSHAKPDNTNAKANLHYIQQLNNQNSEVQGYMNPVFKDPIHLQDSPYRRIQTRKYYEGNKSHIDPNDPPRHHDISSKEINIELQPVQNKGKEISRSRFRSPEHYTPGPTEDEQYLRNMERARVQQQHRTNGNVTPSRRIYPETLKREEGSSSVYEGGRKGKLHSTYFKDETSMLNKRRYDNSEDRKKRKGLLSVYIGGKYNNNYN